MRNLKKLSRLMSSVYILSVILGGSFTTVKAEIDNMPPEFVGIKVDKVAASVGEKINLKVIAKDNLELMDKAQICYVKNDGIYNIEKHYELKLINGEYVTEISANEKNTGDWKVSFIALSDKSNNSIIVYNNEIHKKYGVVGKDLDSGDYQVSAGTFKVEVTSVKIDKNVVIKGDKVNLNVEAKDIESLDSSIEASYEMQGNSICPEKKVILNLQDKKYTANINTSDFQGFGTWKIKSLKLKNKQGQISIVYNDELCKDDNVQKVSMVNGTLNIQPNSNSTLSNDVTIKVSKNEVKRGESIIIEVKGEDSKYKFKDEAYLCLVNKVNGVESEKKLILRKLESTDGIYGGKLSINSNISSGTWKVSYVVLENKDDEANIVYNSNIHPINGKDFSEANFTVIEKCDNTTLKYIAVNGNVIKDFRPDKYEYTYEVEDESIPVITAEAEDRNAVVQIVTPQAIDGEALIKVTAENGGKATYKVKLVDEIKNNAKLNSITIDGNPLVGFNSNIYEYEYYVQNVNIPKVEAIPQDSNTKIQVLYPNGIPGDIKVKSELGGEIKEYTIKLKEAIKIRVMNENMSFKNGQTAIVEINAFNQSKDSRQVALVVGLYNANDSLVQNKNIGVNDKSLIGGQGEDMQVTLGIPEYGKYKIKVFMWDSIKGMHIIKECMEFDVKE